MYNIIILSLNSGFISCIYSHPVHERLQTVDDIVYICMHANSHTLVPCYITLCMCAQFYILYTIVYIY